MSELVVPGPIKGGVATHVVALQEGAVSVYGTTNHKPGPAFSAPFPLWFRANAGLDGKFTCDK